MQYTQRLSDAYVSRIARAVKKSIEAVYQGVPSAVYKLKTCSQHGLDCLIVVVKEALHAIQALLLSLYIVSNDSGKERQAAMSGKRNWASR
eukprot:scaffold24794_cov36-Prasinocladus_malaysianus.AAC.2